MRARNVVAALSTVVVLTALGGGIAFAGNGTGKGTDHYPKPISKSTATTYHHVSSPPPSAKKSTDCPPTKLSSSTPPPAKSSSSIPPPPPVVVSSSSSSTPPPVKASTSTPPPVLEKAAPPPPPDTLPFTGTDDVPQLIATAIGLFSLAALAFVLARRRRLFIQRAH